MKLSQKNTEQDYENDYEALPKGFLLACFIALGLWVLIAYLLN